MTMTMTATTTITATTTTMTLYLLFTYKEEDVDDDDDHLCTTVSRTHLEPDANCTVINRNKLFFLYISSSYFLFLILNLKVHLSCIYIWHKQLHEYTIWMEIRNIYFPT